MVIPESFCLMAWSIPIPGRSGQNLATNLLMALILRTKKSQLQIFHCLIHLFFCPMIIGIVDASKQSKKA